MPLFKGVCGRAARVVATVQKLTILVLNRVGVADLAHAAAAAAPEQAATARLEAWAVTVGLPTTAPMVWTDRLAWVNARLHARASGGGWHTAAAQSAQEGSHAARQPETRGGQVAR